MLSVGSLFSGIGGIDVGLERVGFKIAWQSEIDPYACQVLKRHWPNVPNLGDVRQIRNPPRVDILAGGFPCQDVSTAGERRGIHGTRSSLWFEYARLIGEVRPRWVLVENVPGLLDRGFDQVLRSLAELGYDAEWQTLPAAAFGAPHIRYRVVLLAHPTRHDGRVRQVSERANPTVPGDDGTGQPLADPDGQRRGARIGHLLTRKPDPQGSGWWKVEPGVGRVANGVPDWVDRLRTLGNAVVPQVAEWAAKGILEAEGLA